MSQDAKLPAVIQRAALESGAKLRDDNWYFDDGSLFNFYHFAKVPALQAEPARDKFQSQELMTKVNDRIRSVLQESGLIPPESKG